MSSLAACVKAEPRTAAAIQKTRLFLLIDVAGEWLQGIGVMCGAVFRIRPMIWSPGLTDTLPRSVGTLVSVTIP